MSLRVVHSTPVWLPQTMTWLHTQVRHLPAAEIESHVVCERTANLDQFGVERLHSLSALSRPRSLWDRGLRRLRVRRHLGFLEASARRLGAAIVHSHFGHVGWADSAAARRAGARHVVTFYGVDVNHLPLAVPRWRERYRQLFAGVDRVLCEGPHMARCIVALGCAEDKVHVHRLGVELERIPFRPRSRRPGEPLRVLIAATFREKKGVVWAIEALGAVRDEIPLAITVIGDATAEPRSAADRARIVDAVERHGLGPSIRWLGFRPHAELMEQALTHHVFLSPSVTAADGDTEGGAPVTIIEMAASGMPVISTTHCDIPEVIRHGEGGWLAPERDSAALAGYLRRVAAEPERWPAMAAASRRHVEERFSAAAQGRALARHYLELVEPGR